MGIPEGFEKYGTFDLSFTADESAYKSSNRYIGYRRMSVDEQMLVSYLLINSVNHVDNNALVWVKPEHLEQVLNFIQTLGGLGTDG